MITLLSKSLLIRSGNETVRPGQIPPSQWKTLRLLSAICPIANSRILAIPRIKLKHFVILLSKPKRPVRQSMS